MPLTSAANAPLAMLLVLAFVAGFLAVLIFHQGVWWLLKSRGIMPANIPPAWTMGPSMPPLGVPRLISNSFWGGVWAIALALALRGADGAGFWLPWTGLGAVALTLVALFVVPLLKGDAVSASLQRFAVGCLLNGAWGFGTALLLRVSGVA